MSLKSSAGNSDFHKMFQKREVKTKPGKTFKGARDSNSKRNHLIINIKNLDLLKADSKASLAENTSSSSESAKSIKKKDNFKSIGRDIMEKVQSGPRTHRMGDIYHQIKANVDRIAREAAFKKRKREERYAKVKAKKLLNNPSALSHLKI